jgi:hypothetical protein
LEASRSMRLRRPTGKDPHSAPARPACSGIMQHDRSRAKGFKGSRTRVASGGWAPRYGLPWSRPPAKDGSHPRPIDIYRVLNGPSCARSQCDRTSRHSRSLSGVPTASASSQAIKRLLSSSVRPLAHIPTSTDRTHHQRIPIETELQHNWHPRLPQPVRGSEALLCRRLLRERRHWRRSAYRGATAGYCGRGAVCRSQYAGGRGQKGARVGCSSDWPG